MTEQQANRLSAEAGSLSKIEILVLRNELFALRDRVTSLERQLSTIKQCTDCQMDRNLCVFCQELHSIQHCDYFKYLQVSDRWSVAKKLNLCYRCLEKSHYGLNCPQSKMCGINRCRLTHSALLHDEKRRNRKRSDSNSKCESKPSSAPSGDQSNFLDNLDTFSIEPDFSPHAGVTVATACDGKTDQEKMAENNSIGSINTGILEELNRLAMVAEKEVPFDVIFGGSSEDRSKRLQSQYVTPAPFGELDPRTGTAVVCDSNIDNENLHEPQMDENNYGVSLNNLDLLYNEYVKHPCPIEVVVNFNYENGSVNNETDSEVNSLDPITPGGYDPFRPSGGNFGVSSTVPPLENENIRFAPDGIDINARMYDAGMFYNRCRMPADHQKRTGENTKEKYLEIPSALKSNTDKLDLFDDQCEPSGGKIETEGSTGFKPDCNDVGPLANNWTSPAPPAEEHQKEIDLYKWLMPISDPGGS